MNEYAVVKVQVKENQKMSFTYRPETAGVSTPNSTKKGGDTLCRDLHPFSTTYLPNIALNSSWVYASRPLRLPFSSYTVRTAISPSS